MRSRVPQLLLALAVLSGLCTAVFAAATTVDGVPQPAGAVGPAVDPTDLPSAVAPALGRPVPVRLDIPAIRVHAGLLTLGVQPDRSVAVPPLDSVDAGWYEHSPVPGEIGPAVLLGHVDSARTGPGVFYDLAELVPGDAVRVTRADGTVAAFRVDRVERYPKSAFPTSAVYGDIDHVGLRLITCGGAFDRSEHSYVDNVVVFASGKP